MKRASFLLSHASAVGVGTIIGAASIILWNEESSSKDASGISRTVVEASAAPDNGRLGSPVLPVTISRPNPNLEIAFDHRTRLPLYVFEKIVVGKNNPSLNRKNMSFYEDKSLDEKFRARNGYYRKSGYDRGHLAPAADFMYNENDLHDTFCLSNVCPQLADLNRGPWEVLEKFARTVAEEESATDTFVISGPVFLPSQIIPAGSLRNGKDIFRYTYEGIGTPPSLISVPTHFFKIICSIPKNKDSEKPIKVAAIVLPNQIYKQSVSARLIDSLVPIEALEAVTGLSFFPLIRSACGENANWEKSIDTALQLIGGRHNNLLPFENDKEMSSPKTQFKEKKLDIRHLCEDGRCDKVLLYSKKQGNKLNNL